MTHPWVSSARMGLSAGQVPSKSSPHVSDHGRTEAPVVQGTKRPRDGTHRQRDGSADFHSVSLQVKVATSNEQTAACTADTEFHSV